MPSSQELPHDSSAAPEQAVPGRRLTLIGGQAPAICKPIGRVWMRPGPSGASLAGARGPHQEEPTHELRAECTHDESTAGHRADEGTRPTTESRKATKAKKSNIILLLRIEIKTVKNLIKALQPRIKKRKDRNLKDNVMKEVKIMMLHVNLPVSKTFTRSGKNNSLTRLSI